MSRIIPLFPAAPPRPFLSFPPSTLEMRYPGKPQADKLFQILYKASFVCFSKTGDTNCFYCFTLICKVSKVQIICSNFRLPNVLCLRTPHDSRLKAVNQRLIQQVTQGASVLEPVQTRLFYLQAIVVRVVLCFHLLHFIFSNSTVFSTQ